MAMSKHGDVTQATLDPDARLLLTEQQTPLATERQYISETADFGIYIGVVPDEKMLHGLREVYFVIHKVHQVVATDAVLLSYALEFMQRAQEALDTTTGKSSPHGAN